MAAENSFVVVDANIVTCNPANPRAEALIVLGGWIAAVGTSAEMLEAAGSRLPVVDAAGMTVTPGFIDPHLHPKGVYPAVEHRLHCVDLFEARSMEALVRALRARAEAAPPGEWIQGRGYQDSKLGGHPTARNLDRVSTRHPICITHSSGHLSVVNSFVLEKARVGRSTPDPAGGAFDRTIDGSPNGVCRESAAMLVKELTGVPLPVPTREQEADGLALCLGAFLRKGITSIADAGVTAERLDAYQRLLERQRLPLRVTMMIRYEPGVLAALSCLKLRTGFGGDMLKIGPLKLFAGNSLSGNTCWLYEPYVGSHAGDDPPYYGLPHPTVSSGELTSIILEGHRAGFQWAVHANGDRDIDSLLDAYENALGELPRKDHRHRIEHCSIVGKDTRILRRIQEAGVVPVFHEYTYEHGDKYGDYGEERIAMMHAYRSALDLGIVPGGHSDWPVSAADPMLRIQSMVTRTSAQGLEYGRQQGVSAEEALYVWTMGNARVLFEENRRGSVEPGKLADLVFLSGDPTRVDPEHIKDVEVKKTLLGGAIAFEAAG